MFVVTVVRNN